MLELRDYTLGVLETLIDTKGKQATDRKLTAYGYEYSSTGTGRKRVYTITALPNAFSQFKMYCVHTLGFSPQTDFIKLRDFVFYLFSDDDFNWLPDEMMEEYLRLEGAGMARQTIANYRKRLEDLELIDNHFGDFVYYNVYKRYGVQEHEIITREEYGRAWRLYWEYRNANPDEDSLPAYRHMYNAFGGVPRKQRRVERNAIHARQNTLFNLAADAILEEFGGQRERKPSIIFKLDY